MSGLGTPYIQDEAGAAPPVNYHLPPPSNPADSIPEGGPYYTYPDAGITQRPGGAEAWGRDHRIDPNTGALIGSPGLVPHQYSLDIQAQHEQAVWAAQQRYMREGMSYYRGALGLLQSYRPGGGATIESNIYGQLGQASFQRAQLTQPMDLTADYQREQQSKARMKANRANERNTAIQVAAIAAGAVTGGLGYGAIAGALAAGVGGYLGSKGSRNDTDAAGYDTQYPQGQSTASEYRGPQQVGAPSSNPAAQYGPPAPGGAAGPAGPSAPMGAMSAGGGQGGPPQARAPGGQKQVQGMPGQGGQQMGGGQVVGANGDFTPQAYAMRGAAMLGHPIQQLALSRIVATEMETDPVWQGFTMAVDRELAARYRSAA